MAVSVYGSGSTSSTTADTSFQSVSAVGIYQLYIDLAGSGLTTGDVVEFRTKKIVKTSGTLRTAEVVRISGDDVVTDRGLWPIGDPLWNGLTDAASLQYSMKRIAGTDRTYDWEVLKA